MLKIIDRYIIKKFLLTFIFIIGLFILIAIVFDFSEKVDDFVKNQASLKVILLDYYTHFIPYFLNLFSSLFIFISAVYFTSRMAYQTEIIAILSSGVNFYRLLVPYFIVSLILASFSFYLNGWIIPISNQKLLDFEEKYVLNPYTNKELHIHRKIAPGIFIYMQSYNVQDSIGYQFSLEKFDNNRLEYKLQSQSIKWNSNSQEWVAQRYRIRTIKEMEEKLVSGDKFSLKLPIHPDDFGRKTRNIQTMNNKELNDYIEIERMRGDSMIKYYLVEKYKRVSLPFATFILVLIAFSIASRKVRGGIGMHLGLGILLAFSYLIFLQFSSVFSFKGGLDPLLSVWIPNIVYAILAVILLLRAPK